VQMGVRHVRGVENRLAVGLLGFIHPTKAFQDHAFSVIGGPVTREQPDGLVVFLQRAFRVASLFQETSQVVEAVKGSLIGRIVQRLAVVSSALVRSFREA